MEKEGQETEEHLQIPDPQAGSERTPKPVILVFSDFYLPGYKSGGGMRTLVNIVDRFGEDYDFRIAARDHDGKTDKSAYINISYRTWTRVGKALVQYLSKDQIRLSEVKAIVREVNPDCIFVNSYFSTLTIFVLILRKFGALRNIPVIIAPQGELTEGGLEMKRTKKLAYLRFAASLHLYRDIVWRTTSDIESKEVERAKGEGGRIFVAPDLPPRSIFTGYSQDQKPYKKSGEVKLVYLSRIHPIKNLIFLLELLGNLQGRISLDVYGPVDASPEYVHACHELIAALPDNIDVTLLGGLDHEKVVQTLVEHHFFILPTQSENFGHVFIEALSAGCPLIISDRTPWLELETKGVGWDIPLEDRAKWIDVISRCVEMDQEAFSAISSTARGFAENWIADDAVEEANRTVFEYALSPSREFDTRSA